MADTFYVSPYGDNGNNGLGPDPTDDTDKPFLTIDKAMSTADGQDDIVYIAPGVYRENCTADYSGAAGHPISFIGDPENAQGFCDASGNLLNSGKVILSAATRTGYECNAMTTIRCVTATSKDYLTFKWITFVGSHEYTIHGETCRGWTFEDCIMQVFSPSFYAILMTAAADTPCDLTVRRCILYGTGGGLAFNFSSADTGADYEDLSSIENSHIIGIGVSGINTIGHASTPKRYGIVARNCYIEGGGYGVRTTAWKDAGTNPVITVKDCFIVSSKALYHDVSVTNVLSDGGGNVLCSASSRTNVATVATGNASVRAVHYAFDLQPMRRLSIDGWLGFGCETGFPTTDIDSRPRPSCGFATNTNVTSGTATAGGASTLTDSGKTWTADVYIGQVVNITGGTGSGQKRFVVDNDATSLTVNPAWSTQPSTDSTYEVVQRGLRESAGCAELHDVGTRDIATYDAADASLKMTGPSDQEISVPVDTTASTISIKVRYESTTYGGTSYPQAILLAAPELGVSTETETATASASDAWETLTFTQFTATRKGVVKIRLLNRSTAANGVCWFDTLAVA
jgi:hypothetical protein